MSLLNSVGYKTLFPAKFVTEHRYMDKTQHSRLFHVAEIREFINQYEI